MPRKLCQSRTHCRHVRHGFAYLRAQHVAIADQTQHILSNLSYAGDEGGIVCHIAPPDKEEALAVSLTQVRVPRSMPLAAAVPRYPNHRVKQLKRPPIA